MNNFFKVIPFLLLIVSCSRSSDDDGVIQLRQNGIKVEDKKVIAWFPRDSLSNNEMKEIVDSLNLGIELAKSYIKSPYNWQVFANQPITYYFMPGNFISQTTDNSEIMIPLWRAKKFKSPWLHETMHILLRSNKGNWNEASSINTYLHRPLWLGEGFAEYCAVKISYLNQLPKFDVHGNLGYLKLDSVCKQKLTEENGEYILKYIGTKGLMRQLFGEERGKYAPTFYTCSCSFSKYLTETYGIGTMLTTNSEFEKEHQTLEKMTEKSLATLKEEWLNWLEKKE